MRTQCGCHQLGLSFGFNAGEPDQKYSRVRRCCRRNISPKSLSAVSKIRPASMLRSNTAPSSIPGAASAMNMTSWPSARRRSRSLSRCSRPRRASREGLFHRVDDVGAQYGCGKADGRAHAFSVRLGCDFSMWSTVSPAASFSRISSTVIRVPATVGLPIMILGLATILTCAI